VSVVNYEILKGLVDLWDAHPPGATPDGSRLFARWVSQSGPPDTWGWDDWSLVGAFVPGQLRWSCPTVGYEYQIEQQIHTGAASGRVEPEPGLVVWWCRSELDGPPGPRVSDWSAPSP
jgi:hypothetical protein